MDTALRALADPNRRRILQLVRHDELPAGAIARQFSVTRPAISQHLAVLRQAGLIVERRDGTRRLYRARPDGAAELRLWLEAFWDDGLDQLRESAEHEARTEVRTKEATDGPIRDRS
jgi:DNA-binding transcriptional ArsR family regulator